MPHQAIQTADSWPVADDPLEAALAWVTGALLVNDVAPSTTFFALDPRSQLLAIEAIRTTARAAIATTGLPRDELVEATLSAVRTWMLTDPILD